MDDRVPGIGAGKVLSGLIKRISGDVKSEHRDLVDLEAFL